VSWLQVFAVFCSETNGSINEILLRVWVCFESSDVIDQWQHCAWFRSGQYIFTVHLIMMHLWVCDKGNGDHADPIGGQMTPDNLNFVGLSGKLCWNSWNCWNWGYTLHYRYTVLETDQDLPKIRIPVPPHNHSPRLQTLAFCGFLSTNWATVRVVDDVNHSTLLTPLDGRFGKKYLPLVCLFCALDGRFGKKYLPLVCLFCQMFCLLYPFIAHVCFI